MIAAHETISSSPACTICNGSAVRRVHRLALPDHPIPFVLWQCRTCGVVFNHPRLSGDDIRGQYDGDYYVFQESPARRWARATQLYIEHLLPLEVPSRGQRLCEVGCAGGELLAIARYRGWEAVGVEISTEAAAFACRERGVNVLAGTLEEHAAHIGLFDVAIANDVIEHVPSPRLFIEQLRTILKPDGVASLETPNWGGIWRRLGGAAWLGINRFHICLFDRRSLVRLMTDCGFRDCVVRSSTNLAYASWAARPELMRLIRPLPAGLRWRFERWADRLTPSSFALEISRKPPASLEQALATISASESAQPPGSSSTRNDNLTVIGRA